MSATSEQPDSAGTGRRRLGSHPWRRLRLLVIAFWCGMTWSIGYIVAPVLFNLLAGKTLAGDIAGALFRLQAWLSILIGFALLAMAMFVPAPPGEARQSTLEQTDVRIVIAMMVCTLIGYFALQPLMSVLRATIAAHADLPGGVPIARQFAVVHGVSAAFYLGHSLLGAWLVTRQAR